MTRSFVVIVLSLALLMIVSPVYGYMAFNQSDIAFVPQNPSGESAAIISDLIKNGAGYFFKSHSDMLLFLKMIELSDLSKLDYTELEKVLNSSIENMRNAKETYFDLKNMAEIIPYNQDIIKKLIIFNYGALQVDRNLNIDIFEKVERFLAIGDVRGAYKLFYEGVEYLFERIKSIKSIVDSEKAPEISELWRIKQNYSELGLFAQYITEVFFSL